MNLIMTRKPILTTVRNVLIQAIDLLAKHPSTGKGQIGQAETCIKDAKAKIDDYVNKNGTEEYEDVY